MTEFEKIIAAVEPFGFPHAPDIYEGSEECFFVYNSIMCYMKKRHIFLNSV